MFADNHSRLRLRCFEDNDVSVDLVKLAAPGARSVRRHGEILSRFRNCRAKVGGVWWSDTCHFFLLAVGVHGVKRCPVLEVTIRLLVSGDEVESVVLSDDWTVVEEAFRSSGKLLGFGVPGSGSENPGRSSSFRNEHDIVTVVVSELSVEVDGNSVS